MLRPLTMIAVCWLALGTAARTQPPAPSDERAAQMKERLTQLQTRLMLTPDQIATLKPIVQKEVEELRAVRDKHATDTSAELKEEARSRRQERD